MKTIFAGEMQSYWWTTCNDWTAILLFYSLADLSHRQGRFTVLASFNCFFALAWSILSAKSQIASIFGLHGSLLLPALRHSHSHRDNVVD